LLVLLESCLEDDPSERPADAQELAEELLALIKEPTPDEPIEVVPEPPAPEKPPTVLTEARRLVNRPALALLIAGILTLVWGLMGMLVGGVLFVERERTGPVIFFWYLILFVAGNVVFFAGLSMRQLRRYRLSIAGSIVAMPLVIFLPIGIWSLLT